MKGQHLAKLATTAPATALCSSTLQRTSNQAPKRKQHSDSSTLQRHPAAAPCSSTSNPAAKRKHATLPRLEVYNTPNSFAIWGKKTYEEKSQLWN